MPFNVLSRRKVFSGHKALLLGGLGLAAAGFSAPAPAQAQSQFCPGNFSGGTCISGGQGAVSTAAVSSQALSDASQNVTQVSNDQSNSVVRRRLEQERAAPAARPAAAPARRAARRGPTDIKDGGPMIYKAPPVVEYGPTWAVWGHAYGEWEKWEADTVGIRTLGNDPASISIERRTTTFGFLGGVDVTHRSLDSVWVFGVLAGYMDSTVKFDATSVGRAADNSTISHVKGDISGPTIGGYVTSAWGPWSFDLTGKADFLSIKQSFTEILFANANPVFNSGSGSTDVTNLSVAFNLNYRIPTSATTWWEPTVGFRYTHSDFASDASLLGMTDGDVLRVQGGVRFGAATVWYGMDVVTTLTTLAYSNVSVDGYVLTGGPFFGGTVVPDDEGKVRGQAILAMNFIHSPRTTTFIQGEVRAGEDLFAAGGRIGMRVNLN